MKQVYDLLIVGAGVVGSAVAREFSRYSLKIGVLEKELDVGYETSGRNSGVLHAGFTYKTGSLRARCAVEGNAEFDKVAEELDIPFKRTGKVVVGFSQKDMESLKKFKAVGDANGVPGLEIIDKKRLEELDSSANGEFAMYSPTTGILDPFIYTVALAENAKQNGVEFYFDNEVVSISRENDLFAVATNQGVYKTRWVVNCAGLQSAMISEMLGIGGYTIGGFKGEYILLDKRAGKDLNMPVYPAPASSGGFATHITPTVHGNVLIGPNSEFTEDFDDYGVTAATLEQLMVDGQKMFKHTKREYFIRNFAGIRPKLINKETRQPLDFVVEARTTVPNTINLVGIESPGITAALPLARRAVALYQEKETLSPNPLFNPRRKGIIRFSEQSDDMKRKLIKQDPNYGEIVCRCEMITKAEILQAIHNCLGVHTLVGIKNRTRAMMGRCQGGYCQTRIANMIQEELHGKVTEVLYGRKDSVMFAGKVRAR